MPRNDSIQVRRDTAANWTSVNPMLASGEIGFETDTGKLKVGTGSASWTSLLYATDASDITGTTLASNVIGSSLTSTGTLTSLTITGDVTVDTNTLKVDSTNNRVGVGTASPTTTLDVNGTVTATTFSNGLYKVGDTGPGGGTIFFVDRFNEYADFTYLEMAPTTTHLYRLWAQTSLQSTAVTGADSKALGGGYQNTIDIVAQGNTSAATCAAKYCDALVTGGQSDWYLPSLGELETNEH